MMSSREQLVFLAKCLDETERYIEMKECVKKIVLSGNELSVEERNLFSLAFKNLIGPKRSSLRAYQAISQILETAEDKLTDSIRKEKDKVEEEITSLCNQLFEIITKDYISRIKDPAGKVFFWKMLGDYYRYLCECPKQDIEQVKKEGLEYYKRAEECSESLADTHPIKLGLALNFSVFYYEILNEPVKAQKIAKNAFDKAIEQIEGLQDEQEYKDTTLIMQLLRDGLTLWTVDFEGDTNEP